MGNSSSMLTQYDIEEVQRHCDNLFTQQEIVSLYQRFCQLDRNSKGYILADEFLSVPEFAMNPLSQRLLKMVDGLNFKDFLAILSAFSAKASIQRKIEFFISSEREGLTSVVISPSAYQKQGTLCSKFTMWTLMGRCLSMT
ncbi:calcineurin subunit B-like isoform X4 [Benincasa hispida]|uniref:calcineurin subunit B-like isoform X4 n=1 Tax=Benincasa hispida TaxID=102211 RepID=UPI00190043A2|nr:calcineurin subunit B-like isoform X4 [Benincasa hispida]